MSQQACDCLCELYVRILLLIGYMLVFFKGFIATVIKSLWGALEVVDDSPVVTPKSWPVTPIDKTSKKVFYCYIFYIFKNIICQVKSSTEIVKMLLQSFLPK